MFLIPWNTDAPIYYWPFATVGLIFVNIVVFFITISSDDPELITSLWLEHGHGLHPLQWVTSNFLHAGIMHLVGNMIFLWSFGLVVEGKIGWWKFLLAYLAIGAVQCAIEQTLALSSDGGGSLGASAIVFGVMAMALIWAPKNEMSCVGFFWFFVFMRVFTFDLSIRVLAGAYIALDLVGSLYHSLEFRTELFHSMGALIGIALAVAMLKLNWVDCEGWDLLTLLAQRHGKKPRTERRESLTFGAPVDLSTAPIDIPGVQSPSIAKLEKALATLRKALHEGHGHAAYLTYEKIVGAAGKWELPERELLQLIDALHADKAWADSIPLLEDYLRRFKEHEITLRLRLAKIVIQEQRPSYALRVLEKLPREPLPELLEKLRKRLVKQATDMKEEGYLELEGQSW